MRYFHVRDIAKDFKRRATTSVRPLAHGDIRACLIHGDTNDLSSDCIHTMPPVSSKQGTHKTSALKDEDMGGEQDKSMSESRIHNIYTVPPATKLRARPLTCKICPRPCNTMNATQLAPHPSFIGATFNILLYGIMITQTHVYFATHKADWLWMKIFITFLFFANTASSILTVICAHQSLINHFGDSSWSTQTNWIFATDPIITGIISGSVQLFFAWQVYILRREVFIVSAIVFCSSVGMLGVLGTTITADFVEFQKLKALVITRLVIATCADLIIATTLMLHLGNRKDNFPVTSNVVIRMTMQTGLITTLFAVTNLVTFLSIDTGVHLIFSLPLASLHANSLLSRLNSPGGWEHNKLSEVNNCDQGCPERGTTRLQSSVCPEVFVHIEEHKLVELNSRLNDSFSQLNGQNGWSDQSKSGI